MKTLIFALCAFAATAFGQVDRPTYNTSTKVFISPTPAQLRTANEFQQSGSILETLRTNASATIDIHNVSIQAGGLQLSTLGLSLNSGGDLYHPLVIKDSTGVAIENVFSGPITINQGSEGIKIPQLRWTGFNGSITHNGAAFQIAADSPGLSIQRTGDETTATTPMIKLWASNEDWNGNAIEVKDFEDGVILYKVTAGGAVTAQTYTGNGAAITALNMGNASSGILAGARGGTNNGFMQFTGPTTSTKTFTVPNANATLAYTAQNLSVFAATSSAQLAGVLSDETGFETAGKVVFSESPTISGLASFSTLNVTPADDFAAAIAVEYFAEDARANPLLQFAIPVDTAASTEVIKVLGVDFDPVFSLNAGGDMVATTLSAAALQSTILRSSGSNAILVKPNNVTKAKFWPSGGLSIGATAVAGADPGDGVLKINGVQASYISSDNAYFNGGIFDSVGNSSDDAGGDSAIFMGDNASGGNWINISTIGLTTFAVNNGGAASAGQLGEYVESKIAVGSAVSLTTATSANVTSISLTAGDWEVSSNVNFVETGTTATEIVAGVSSTTATVPTDGTEVYNGSLGVSISGKSSATPKSRRFLLGTTTTVYLTAKGTFSLGTLTAFGSIAARRIR